MIHFSSNRPSAFLADGIAGIVLLLLSFPMDASCQTKSFTSSLIINEDGYYEMPGLNVMLFDDFYPEGHQGGLTIVQSGRRVAANGDVRLEPTPGQWSPVPVLRRKVVDRDREIIEVELSYPDSSKDRKGFNPLVYPDLRLTYTIKTEILGETIRLTVDLEHSLPKIWADRVGFSLELFPGQYFGKHYLMNGHSGFFPRQPDGLMTIDKEGNPQKTPLATGTQLDIAPGDQGTEIRFVTNTSPLQLIDGRGLHNNGWFILRSTIPSGVAKNAVEWMITPSVIDHWRYSPVVQVSQVGYHPKQRKFAVIELDKLTDTFHQVQLIRIEDRAERVVKTDMAPHPWGNFLRYKYLRFDFTDVHAEGIYKVRYGSISSNEFEIRNDIFAKNVWQPTLEYFLPEQMCHMRVNDRYKVWHGLCHMDDARMAPLNHNHFDGYYQHESTLTRFTPGEHVPGLNIGGWHDAGDYDLRIESQAETVYKLALAYELFPNNYDATTIDEISQVAQLHHRDGKPDMLQQIGHGVLSIVNGFEAMGRLYRGIICPTLKQYVHLGDASTMTDNLVFKKDVNDPILNQPLPDDDRLVFTENNPPREFYVAQALAAANRVLMGSDPEMAERCLRVAESLYHRHDSTSGIEKINAAAELFLTTSKDQYRQVLIQNSALISQHIEQFSEVVGRLVAKMNDPGFSAAIENGVRKAYENIREQQSENPYGVPYRPHIWGAGWGVQSFGVRLLFLHLGFPNIVPSEFAFNALNFVLGCHPGENTASFVSGVGVNSLTVAYGANRDEWSYIPGGVGSGTALIRPDLPELKIWPYFWQQTEYVMGGGAVDFLILALAADSLLQE